MAAEALYDNSIDHPKLEFGQQGHGHHHHPSATQLLLVNSTNRPINYKLKCNQRGSFKVVPRAQGTVRGEQTSRLTVTWLWADPNDHQSTPKLLLQTRFADAQPEEPNSVTRTRLEASLQPTHEAGTETIPQLRVLLEERAPTSTEICPEEDSHLSIIPLSTAVRNQRLFLSFNLSLFGLLLVIVLLNSFFSFWFSFTPKE